MRLEKEVLTVSFNIQLENGGNKMTKKHSLVLANKLKQLRKEQNLKIHTLAEFIDVSHAFIYLLEKAERGASRETLEKYAKFFKVDLEELLYLQKILPAGQEVEHKVKEEFPSYINDYVSYILTFNESIRIEHCEEQMELLRNKFQSMLQNYDLSEVKQIVSKAKKSWFSFEKESEFETNTLCGSLQVPEKQVYFKLKLTETCCLVQFLYEDQKIVDYLKVWLKEEKVTFLSTEVIPHLQELQKVKNFIWFSPKISVINQLECLVEDGVSLKSVQNYLFT